MGIYLVIEANNGLILIWDRKTSLFVNLSPKYKVTMQCMIDSFSFYCDHNYAKKKKDSLFLMFKVEQHDITLLF